MLAILSAVLFTAAAAEPTTPPPMSASETEANRAVAAAERAALAAQAAAEAAGKVADIAHQLLAVKAPAPASEEKAPGEKKTDVTWTGTVGGGLISMTGNTSSVSTNANAAFERTSPSWIWGVKALAAYGQSRASADQPSQVLAMSAGLEARGARRWTERASTYVALGVETDHVKSIEARPSAEGGLGLIWLESMDGDFVRTRLRTDVALLYARELRFQYYPTPAQVPDLTIVAPKIGVFLRHALDRDVIFTEELEVLLDVVTASHVLAVSTTKIATRLVGALSLGVSFLVTHDSLPAPGKRATDTALMIGLEVGF